MQSTWQPLKKHDKVRIIAPGARSPISNEPSSCWKDLEKGCDLLRSWNLEPVFSPTIFKEHESYYNFSNTDRARYEDFVDAFQSDAAVVWSFRGGYGSDRIMSAVHKNQTKPSSPKLFIGFSDVTTIHSYMNSHWQMSTLHALSLRQLALNLTDEKDIRTTREIIFGEIAQVTFPLQALNAAARTEKLINATITGGNLTIVQTSLGTPWQPNIKNTILLLEDVGEAPYRIARIFQQFLANGFLNSTKAILLGDFIPEENMDLVLNEFVEQIDIPVLRSKTIGHGKNNHPVPLGTAVELQLGKMPSITIAAR